VKGQGFTIRVKELPDLAEGVQRALDMALKEVRTGENTRPAYRSAEGVGAEL
jgi:hypothetical protein